MSVNLLAAAHLTGRPRLIGALALGFLVWLGLTLWPNSLSWSSRAIIGWDAAMLVFLGLVLQLVCTCDIGQLQALAAKQDEAKGLILGLSIFAAAAAVMAIGVEISLAKDEHGLEKTLRVLLAFLTLAMSWLFVHVIFALHYAHEYYAPDPTEGLDEDGLRGGLHFPGDEEPDYWDFIHFAVVIGVASQTADIEFTSRTQRRIGTIHGLVSFVFNTVVLALTINLLAGLF